MVFNCEKYSPVRLRRRRREFIWLSAHKLFYLQLLQKGETQIRNLEKRRRYSGGNSSVEREQWRESGTSVSSV